MIKQQEDGKIIVRLKGTYKQLDRLINLFESGKLQKELGIPILEVDAFSVDQPTQKQQKRPKVNLSEWLKGEFTAGWQSLNTFLDPEKTLAYNTLSESEKESAEGGKLIKVEMDLGNEKTVLLNIKIQQVTKENVEIKAQLLPTGGEKYLPPSLTLARLSKSGKVSKKVQSESMDNYIQFEFTGKLGGSFGIQVIYRNAKLLEEYFVA